MIALIQRVKHASVSVSENSVSEKIVGQIDQGLLVFLGVQQQDTALISARLLKKVLGYRVFADENGKMNKNVQQAGGSLLVVSQFTLVADTQSGLRPSFSRGATPEQAEKLYLDFVAQACAAGVNTQSGQFAADMQVELCNDGPVTFWLQV